MRQQFVQIACSILASAALATPALAQSETASVSGIVRDRHGAPQIDALIQLMRPDSSVVAIAHTDVRGVFQLEDLLPGVYQIKASDESFLPSLRQNLRVVAHHKTIANMTLSTLLDAVHAAFAWIRRLDGVPQDAVHHGEGDVATHTRMAVEAIEGWLLAAGLTPVAGTGGQSLQRCRR